MTRRRTTSSAGRIQVSPKRKARAANVIAVIVAPAMRTVRSGIRSPFIDCWVHAASGHQPRAAPTTNATTAVITVSSGMMCSVAAAAASAGHVCTLHRHDRPRLPQLRQGRMGAPWATKQIARTTR